MHYTHVYEQTNFGGELPTDPNFGVISGLPNKYQNLYNKLYDLHEAMVGLGTNESKIFDTVDSMSSEQKCWLCYRSRAYDDGRSMISAVQKELSGDDLDTFFNKLKCTDYGYKSIGNDGGPNNWKCKK